MRLFEHADFDQAIIRATEHFRARGLRESVIEKDDYVTESLELPFWGAVSAVVSIIGTKLMAYIGSAKDIVERMRPNLLALHPLSRAV